MNKSVLFKVSGVLNRLVVTRAKVEVEVEEEEEATSNDLDELAFSLGDRNGPPVLLLLLSLLLLLLDVGEGCVGETASVTVIFAKGLDNSFVSNGVSLRALNSGSRDTSERP